MRVRIFQWIVDSSIFWAGILNFACNYSIFARISDLGQKWKGGFG